MSIEFDELCQRNKAFVLYVGPELSEAAGLPNRSAMLEALIAQASSIVSAEALDEVRELADDPKEPDHAVFSGLRDQLTAPTFGRAVERLLDDRRKPIPPLGQALAELGEHANGVLTSNLDHLLERAFAGMLDVHAKPVADLGTREGWLLKLQGTLRDRSTWKLTTEQRRHALYVDPLHRKLFSALFLMQTIVFVATPVDDPVFGDIVDEIAAIADGQPPTHYMFVERARAKPRHRRRLAAAGISLITYEGPEHLLELLARLAGRETTTVREALPSAVVAATPPHPAPTPSPAPTKGLAILFAAANPKGTDPLRVHQEERFVREAIKMSRNRDRLHLDTLPAVTFTDLRRALLDGSYDIVHISGHAESQGLLLEDDQGEPVQIAPRGLAMVLGNCLPPAGRLRCVLLNACYSLDTIETEPMQVCHTVAMQGPISDRAALQFTRGFYDAIGAGYGVTRAFDEGMACVAALAARSRFDARLVTRPDCQGDEAKL